MALPEPLVETTALAVPLLAEPSSPDRAGDARRGRWLEAIADGAMAAAALGSRPRPRTCRWPEPTAPTSSLLAATGRRRRPGDPPASTPAAVTVDAGRLARPDPAPGVPGGADARAALARGRAAGRDPCGGDRRPGRGGHRGRAARAGRPDDRPRRRLRHRSATSSASPSAASRRSSTSWPGPRSSSSSPGRRSTPRPGRSTQGNRTPSRAASAAKAQRLRGRRPRPPGSPSRSTGPSATPGSATCTCSSSGPGRSPRRGGRPPTTAARVLDSLVVGSGHGSTTERRGHGPA